MLVSGVTILGILKLYYLLIMSHNFEIVDFYQLFLNLFNRPDYTKLGALRQKYPRVKIMALTATATPVVRADILKQLGMQNSKWFLCSFNRPNLKYEVRPKKGKKSASQDIIELLQSKNLKGLSGIVYCFSRKECESTADELMQNKISVRFLFLALKCWFLVQKNCSILAFHNYIFD